MEIDFDALIEDATAKWDAAAGAATRQDVEAVNAVLGMATRVARDAFEQSLVLAHLRLQASVWSSPSDGLTVSVSPEMAADGSFALTIASDLRSDGDPATGRIWIADKAGDATVAWAIDGRCNVHTSRPYADWQIAKTARRHATQVDEGQLRTDS